MIERPSSGISWDAVLALPLRRRIVLLPCLLYVLAFAVVPRFLGDLPYLCSWSYAAQLSASCAGTIAFALVFYIATRQSWDGDFSTPVEGQDSKALLAKIVMLSVLTFCVAGGCGDIFAEMVRFLPAQRYEGLVAVVDVRYGSNRHAYPYASLEVCDVPGGTMRYLTLSSGLFKYPGFQVGDELRLEGKQNLFGVYVGSFQVVSGQHG